MPDSTTRATAALTADERDDLAAGCHYEREAPAGSEPTCICGVPWICPEWHMIRE